MGLADSTMKSDVNNILQKSKAQKKRRFIKHQNSWEQKREKAALKESGDFIEVMEQEVYLRTKLIWTNARLVFLRDYLQTL